MRASRTFMFLTPVVILAGCGAPQQHSARVLQNRLQTNLSPQLTDHQAAITNSSDGASVTLNEPVLFGPGQADLSTNGSYVIASVTEALLDPRLMQVEVTDTSNLSDDLRSARERSIQGYIEANQLGPPLPVDTRPPPAPAGQSASTILITMHVHCPPGPQGTTWGYPNRGATCN